MRYSKHNEVIYNYISSSYIHPTAETVYNEVKKTIPNISLGTVYRNLTALVNEGKINKISIASGSDRYDKISTPHHHMVCNKCGKVIDVNLNKNIDVDNIVSLENKDLNCDITDMDIMFYGICNKCK